MSGNHHGEIISGDEGKFHDGTPEPALILLRETRLASTAAGLCHGTPPIKKSRAAEELRNLVEEHWPWLLPKLEPQTLRADRSPPLRFEALARLTPTSGYGLGKFCGYVVGDPFSLLARVASAQDGLGDHVR